MLPVARTSGSNVVLRTVIVACLHLLTFKIPLNFKVFLIIILNFNTILQASVGVTLVFANFVIIGVLAITVLTYILTLLLLDFHFELRVAIDKFLQPSQIFSVAFIGFVAMALLAKSETRQMLSYQRTLPAFLVIPFFAKLNQCMASLELYRVISHPSHHHLPVFQETRSLIARDRCSFGQKFTCHHGRSWDRSGIGDDLKNEKGHNWCCLRKHHGETICSPLGYSVDFVGANLYAQLL
mmetsp:Transcript_19809/g.29446  ORF Transcript_19809/g.29446 Transcript_19809/m.29446 type:complete len:239 (-) Transcript_19809:27-743(-)